MALNSNAMTTLNQAKAYLKIPLADITQDALVELWINAASEMIEKECDRIFKAKTGIVEYSSGNRSNIILLKQWPINGVTSLHIDRESDFTDPNTLIDADEYRITDDQQSIVLLNRQFDLGYHNIKVVYDAGYSTIPSDLELACLWVVYWQYKLRNSEDIGRVSKSKGDESTSYLQEAPADVKNTILRHKRTEFPSDDLMIRNIG